MTREQLAILHQAVFVATAYYMDREARVKDMFPIPNTEDGEKLRAKRLKDLESASKVLLEMGKLF